MKNPQVWFIHSQIRKHRSMAEFLLYCFLCIRRYCSQRRIDKSVQIKGDCFQLCVQRNSYITQVDSIHSARAIYKRSAFKIPTESVLQIQDWFYEHGCKMVGWNTPGRDFVPAPVEKNFAGVAGLGVSDLKLSKRKSCMVLATMTSEGCVQLSRKWPQSAGHFIRCPRYTNTLLKDEVFFFSYWEWHSWLKIQHNWLIYFLFMWRHRKAQEVANFFKLGSCPDNPSWQ